MYVLGRDFNFLEVMDACESETYPGMYLRNPGRVDSTQSHDNLIALASGCLFVGDETRFKNVLTWWPNFNNKDPTRFQLRRGSPSGLHNPAAVFLYQLASGNYNPNWFRTAWLIGHSLFTACYPRIAYSHHSERALLWLQMQATRKVIHKIPKVKAWAIKAAFNISEVILNWKVRHYHSSTNWIVYLSWYYGNYHPIASAARKAARSGPTA